MATSDPRTVFAAELSAAVKASGRTQADIAEAVGVKQSTVSAWMLAKAMPELPTIKELAHLLDRRREAAWVALKLATLESNRRRGPQRPHSRLEHAVDSSTAPAGAAALSGKINQLSDEDRAYVESLVDRLLDAE